MKVLFLSFVMFVSYNSYAQNADCRQIKDRMVLFCESVKDQCDFIQNCLVRRDTCVEGKPKSAEDCNRLNKCVKSVSSRLPEREKCDYRWSTTSTSSFCGVDADWLFFEEACPGNVDGIMTAMAYGLEATVDSDFSCRSVNVKYTKKKESCLDYRKKFATHCMGTNSEEDRSLYDSTAPGTCEEHEKFETYPKGYFYLSVEGIEEHTQNRGLPVNDPSIKSLGQPELRNVSPR
ncbi:MAG: hypothetical protein K9K67_07155 [Bacteriovoracaceae bacterium]|nr:hypothetical protein [Bacteriovoracaceae bacterium]